MFAGTETGAGAVSTSGASRAPQAATTATTRARTARRPTAEPRAGAFMATSAWRSANAAAFGLGAAAFLAASARQSANVAAFGLGAAAFVAASSRLWVADSWAASLAVAFATRRFMDLYSLTARGGLTRRLRGAGARGRRRRAA